MLINLLFIYSDETFLPLRSDYWISVYVCVSVCRCVNGKDRKQHLALEKESYMTESNFR